MKEWLFIGFAGGLIVGIVITLGMLTALGIIGGDDDDGRA